MESAEPIIKINFSNSHLINLLNKLFLAASFFIPLIVYTITLAPGITMGDAGELIAAAAGLGVPHPPGAPTWVLLTHLFTKIPISNIAWRVNFASAFYAASSCSLLYLITRHLLTVRASVNASRELLAHSDFSTRDYPRSKNSATTVRASVLTSREPGLWIPAFAGMTALTFAFTPTLWANAVVAEVYTLMVLFSLLSFYMVLLWQQKRQLIYIFLAGLFCSLGFGVHYQVALIFPALAGFVIVALFCRDGASFGVPQDKFSVSTGRERVIYLIKIVGMGIVGLLIGLLVFTYLPLAAKSNPIINWGNPSTWESFWYHVLRKQYSINDLNIGGLNIPFSNPTQTGGLAERFIIAAKSLLLINYWEIGLLLIASLFGLWGAKKNLPLLTFFILFILSVFGFSFLTRTEIPVKDSQFFDLIAFFPFLILLSVIPVKAGIQLSWIPNRVGNDTKKRIQHFLPLVLTLIPLLFLLTNFSQNNWHNNKVAQYFVKDTLALAPTNSTIIFSGDLIFPLIYQTAVEGERSDLILKDRGGAIDPYAYNLPHSQDIPLTMEIVGAYDKKVIDEAPGNVYMLYQNECEPSTEYYGFLSVIKKTQEQEPLDWNTAFGEMLSLTHKDLTGDVFGQLIAASYHLQKGYWHFQNKQQAEATNEFAKAEEIGGPNNFSNINSVGACYFAIGEKVKGLELLSKAQAMRPDSAGIHYNLGLKLMEAGEYQSSAEHFEKAISLNSLFLVRAGKNLGLVYAKLNEWEKASNMLEQVYKQDPTSADFSFYYALGLANVKQKNFANAVTYLEKADSLKPNTEGVLEILAISYFNTKQLEKANTIANELLQLNPSNKYAQEIMTH